MKVPTLKKMKPVVNRSFPSVFTLERGRVVCLICEGETVYKRDYKWLCLINSKALGLEFSKYSTMLSSA